MNRPMTGRQQGLTATEVMIALAIMATITIGGISASAASRRIALVSAASDLRSELVRTRSLAVARDRNIAVRFRDDGDGIAWTAYEDGDGDGVRNDDIAAGIDRPVGATRRPAKPIRIGNPSGNIPDPSATGPLGTRSPVRFNSSALCSFSPGGDATNGSVILTDGSGAAILEVQGATADITVRWWNGDRWVSRNGLF